MKTVADFLNAGQAQGKPCPISITDEFWMGQLNALFTQLREQDKTIREQENDIENLRRRTFRRARTAV